MDKARINRAFSAGLIAIGFGCLGGCASTEPGPQWAGAENLQFSEDARDPTEREMEGGFYRFRPREDPKGTASLLDKDRRPPGFRSDDSP